MDANTYRIDAQKHVNPKIKLLACKYKNDTTIEDIKELWKIFPNDNESRNGIIEILEKIPAEDAGWFLLENFNQIYDDKMKLKTVKLLGGIGTADAIELLLSINDSSLLKSEAEKAVLKIQSRLKDAESGQLTLTEVNAEGGELSITDADLTKNEEEK